MLCLPFLNSIVVVADQWYNYTMKSRYQYRIYPTTEQQTKLAKLFGCCRVVWNDALAHCIELYKSGEKKLSNSQLQKKFITQAKKMVEREWLRIGF
ncbi:transposase [Lyngbya sp. PCC 8106]|nr:transposase [Lyngbya sp. PCC 8106]